MGPCPSIQRLIIITLLVVNKSKFEKESSVSGKQWLSSYPFLCPKKLFGKVYGAEKMQ